MADLTPQPISTFGEITNLNGFNNESLITLLNANASTPATKNANLKFKNLYTLVKSNLNLTDADINTGINPSNINTTQLASIASITVNQYGRVVQIAGSPVSGTTPQAGIEAGSFSSTIVVPSSQPGNAPFFGNSSNFTCVYNGKVLVTIYFTATYNYSSGNNTILFTSNIPIYITNNSNVVTEVSFKTQSVRTTSTGKSGQHILSGTAVILLPSSPNTTNWRVGVGYATDIPGNNGFNFDYAVIFQNNTQ